MQEKESKEEKSKSYICQVLHLNAQWQRYQDKFATLNFVTINEILMKGRGCKHFAPKYNYMHLVVLR